VAGDEVREEVVRALTQTNPAAGLTPAQAELWFNARPAERDAVVGFHSAEAVRLLREAGIVRRTPTVFDLRPEDVECGYRQFEALRSLRLDPSLGWRPGVGLGEFMKTTTPDRAARVVRELRAVGFRDFDED